MCIKRFEKKTDIVSFLELLTSLLKSGLPVKRCLESLEENRSCSEYARIIKRGLENSETAGHSLAIAFRKLSRYEAMLLSAEKTGSIVPVLQNITEEMKEEKDNRYDAVMTLLYPVIITVTALVLSLLLLFYALPFIQKVSDVDRLTVIRGIILSNIWLLLSVCLTVFLIMYFSGKSDFQYRFFRTLYYLSLNRVSTDESVRLVLRENATNRRCSKIIAGVLTGLREGKKLSSLCHEARVFDSFTNAWLCAAEGSGEVTACFEKIFLHYKDERKRQRDAVKRFLEPVIMAETGIYILILITICIVPVFRNLGSTLF